MKTTSETLYGLAYYCTCAIISNANKIQKLFLKIDYFIYKLKNVKFNNNEK